MALSWFASRAGAGFALRFLLYHSVRPSRGQCAYALQVADSIRRGLNPERADCPSAQARR